MRLLDAAATVIASKGFAAATVEDIVGHAGYTRGAFYSNFASKTDLFIELLKADHARMWDGLQQELAVAFREEDHHASLHSDPHEGLERSMLWSDARHHALRDATFRQQFDALVCELRDRVCVAMDECCMRIGIELSVPSSTLALAALALIDGSLYFDIDRPGEPAGSVLRANLRLLFTAAFAGKQI